MGSFTKNNDIDINVYVLRKQSIKNPASGVLYANGHCYNTILDHEISGITTTCYMLNLEFMI